MKIHQLTVSDALASVRSSAQGLASVEAAAVDLAPAKAEMLVAAI